ncbi:hypothetical protein MMC09_006187 [Bachmanniomyces sp. S44760]|nr:hypothetical protein [Bachmanniomyces sp. S44760]
MSGEGVLSPQETAAVNPAPVESPTTTATEATSDPVRPTGSDVPATENQPEIAAAGESVPTSTNEPAPTEEEKVAADGTKVTAQPVAEGQLGYKAPGLLKSLRFSKHVFWFGHAAVEPSTLTAYLRSEKPEIAHPNAAYATQTGKGLLFFAKRVEDMSQPAGILNLGEATEVTKEGLNEFFFKIHGHRHAFQAATRAERDSWIVAVEKEVTNAKTTRDGIVASDGYKNHLNKLAKPVAGAAVGGAVAKSLPTRSKSRDPKVTDETKKSEVAAAIPVAAEEPHKKTEKSRSQSRKRASIFGSLLGKKEEHDEKKEVKAEEKATDKEVKKEVMPTKDDTVENKVENQVEKGVNKPDAIQPAPLNAAAVAARVVDEPIVPAESSKLHGDEEVTGTTAGDPVPETAPKQPETAPKPSKRNSVFGGLFNKKDVTNPPAEPVEKGAPAVPAKDNETVPVSKDAPQLDTPVDTTSPAEAATAPEATKSATSPISTNPSEQKGGIFGFMKQKEVQHDEKKDLDKEEQVEKKTDIPAATSTTTSAVDPSGDAAAKGITTPTTPDMAKDKRRSSFFGTLGTKKQRKPDGMSDTEGTDGEGKKSGSDKIGGIFRKASRSARGAMSGKSAAAEDTPPAPISKDVSESNGINGNKTSPEATETKSAGAAPPAETSANDMPNDMLSEANKSQAAAVEASA